MPTTPTATTPEGATGIAPIDEALQAARARMADADTRRLLGVGLAVASGGLLAAIGYVVGQASQEKKIEEYRRREGGFAAQLALAGKRQQRSDYQIEEWMERFGIPESEDVHRWGNDNE